jgi:hypothetical protein
MIFIYDMPEGTIEARRGDYTTMARRVKLIRHGKGERVIIDRDRILIDIRHCDDRGVAGIPYT